MVPRPRSVRVRTTLVATAAVGLALALAAWALVVILQRSLIGGVQNSLELRSADISSLASSGNLGTPPALPGRPAALLQLIDASGRVLAASSALQGRPAIGPFRAPGSPTTAWSERLTSDDEMYRIVGKSAATPMGPVTIYAAASLESVSDSVTRVKGALTFGLPLLLVIVAATCWWIVGRALAPVEAIRSQVSEIGSGGLDRRVPEPSGRDEIGRLAQTMNEMLDRLEAASKRQRRFVANASHELRSPLASLRTQLEVQRTYPESAGQGPEAMSSQLAEVGRMERLVTDLLSLARADEGKLATRRKPVALHHVVIEQIQGSLPPGQVLVDTSGIRPATLLGDREELARAVRNLLENGARHARSRISVGLHSKDGQIELTIADDGPGIPAEARERVFERFTRLDEGRTRDGGGAGLGLAIVQEIVAAHGGVIRVEGGESGARFVISLPSNGSKSAAPGARS